MIAHHADGGLGDPLAIKPKLECEGGPPGAKRREAQTVHLTATPKESGGGVSFGAWAGPAFPFGQEERAAAGGTYTFLAVAGERAKGVTIIRTAATSAPSGDFVFDNAFSSATLTPPAPFSGSAIFQRNADGTISWAGSLAVSFPGMPDVPLVGPQFETTLGRG